MSSSPEDSPSWLKHTCRAFAYGKLPQGSIESDGEPNKTDTDIGFLWPAGTTLKYGFVDGTHCGNEIQHQKVDKLINSWLRYAPVTFERAEPASVRISFNSNEPSWSYIGDELLDILPPKPTTNLSLVDGESSEISSLDQGVILHQIGHILGLIHEHDLTPKGVRVIDDVDAFQRLLQVNVAHEATDAFDEEALEKFNKGLDGNYAKFDELSIMRFYMPPELNLERRGSVPDTELSDFDKAYMIIRYPVYVPDTALVKDTPRWSLGRVLEIVGADPSFISSICELAEKGDWAKFRDMFLQWSSRLHKQIMRRAAPIKELKWCGSSEKVSHLFDWKFDVAQDAGNLWLPYEPINVSFQVYMNVGSIDPVRPQPTTLRRRFRNVAQYYQRHTSIRFNFIDDSPSSQGDIRIFIHNASTISRRESWSIVGRKSKEYVNNGLFYGGKVLTTMLLAYKDETGWEDAAVRDMLHMVWQAAGFEHEDGYAAGELSPDNRPQIPSTTSTDEEWIAYVAQLAEGGGTPWSFEQNGTDLSFFKAMYPKKPEEGGASEFQQAILNLGFEDCFSCTQDAMQAYRNAFKYSTNTLEFKESIRRLRMSIAEELAVNNLLRRIDDMKSNSKPLSRSHNLH